MFKFYLHVNGKNSSADDNPMSHFQIPLEVNGLGGMGLFFGDPNGRILSLDVRGVF